MPPSADPSMLLPPETFLNILSFLQPPALLRCQRVSRGWHEVCSDEALWRALALRLGYCQLDRRAQEQQSGTAVVASVLQRLNSEADADLDKDMLGRTVQRYRSRNTTAYFDGCNSWQSLCCKLWQLDCNWTGKDATGLNPQAQDVGSSTSSADDQHEGEPSTCILPRHRKLHERTYGLGVWRCKLDPEERTLIVTGQAGGIQVFDHSTMTLLWHIAKTATRACPHLEFSAGWIVFDRPGNHFEVWRSERLVPDLGRTPDRGHYQRFAILSSARPVRAYRFQYPFLCAASQDGRIMFWNVPEQELVQTIDVRDAPHREGNVNYVDFDDDFVFLNGVGAKTFSVYSRHTSRLVWNLGQHFAAGRPPPATWRVRDALAPALENAGFVRCELQRSPPNLWQAGPNTMNLAQLTMTPYQIWSAVHPDLKTRTLLILGHGTVLLIRDYKKFFDDPSQPPDMFVEVEFENLEEYYERKVLGGREDWSDQGWNSRRLWEMLGDAQLTVHEGRAVIVNEDALILDFNLEAAARHPGEGSADRPPASLVPAAANEEGGSRDDQADATYEQAPPLLVYRAMNQPHTYGICSSLQMDEVGIYYTADQPAGGDFEMPEDIDLLPDRQMGDRHVLMHLDFSQRQKVIPRQAPSVASD